MKTKHMYRKWIWCSAGVALFYNIFFLIWMILKPGNQDSYKVVSDVGEMLGALMTMFFCLFSPVCLHFIHDRWQRRTSPASAETQLRFPWAPFLLGLSFADTALGYIIYTYFDTHNLSPFPSVGDIAFISACFLQVSGIILLPTCRISTTARVRMFLDSLMIMATVVTFSWYFILGPTMLQGGQDLLSVIVGSAYPIFDLIMIFCVLLLTLRSNDPTLHKSQYLLSGGLLVLVFCDYLYNYIVLHGTYVNGWLDAGWPIADALQGLAMMALPINHIWQKNIQKKAAATLSERPVFWSAFLPYILVPAAIVLAIFISQTSTNSLLSLGVYIGTALLLVALFIRQILAIRESYQLNEALHTANVCLAATANTDGLTNLPNHSSLLERLEQEINRADRSGRPISLLFFDGDHFKRVNDTYGHAVGDAVLRELSERASKTVRKGDIVGRYGGEEFLVLLPETETKEAREIAERLRAAVANSPLASEMVKGGIPTTISIGLATYPQDGTLLEEVQEKADQAMYWAKRLGRNQICTSADAELADQDSALKIATSASLERPDSSETISIAATPAAQGDEQMGLILSFMDAFPLHDNSTPGHAQAVSDLVTAIAQYSLEEAHQVLPIIIASLLQDVEDIAPPASPHASLSEQEWSLLRQMAALRAAILEVSPALSDLIPAIRHPYQHESLIAIADHAMMAGRDQGGNQVHSIKDVKILTHP